MLCAQPNKAVHAGGERASERAKPATTTRGRTWSLESCVKEMPPQL